MNIYRKRTNVFFYLQQNIAQTFSGWKSKDDWTLRKLQVNQTAIYVCECPISTRVKFTFFYSSLPSSNVFAGIPVSLKTIEKEILQKTPGQDNFTWFKMGNIWVRKCTLTKQVSIPAVKYFTVMFRAQCSSSLYFLYVTILKWYVVTLQW